MDKNFTSGASSVTIQYSVTGNCQNKVSFTKDSDFISTSKTSTSITISVSENRGEARTGHVYTYYDNTRCGNNTITIIQAAGPCIPETVSYQYNDYIGSVGACDTSAKVTVSGVKTTTYRDESCEQETEQVTTSVTLNFDKNTSSNEKTIQSSFTINNSNFTVVLAQPGGCSEPVECELDSVTFTPDSGQTIQVSGCNTSQNITLRGTSESSYTNCESTREITTKSATVNYPKNENSSPSNWQVTVSGVSVTLSRTACAPSPQHRTVSGSPYCDGNDKKVDICEQISYDNGATWENESSSTTVIEYDSTDCNDTYKRQYLTIESLSNNNTIYFRTTNTGEDKTILVSTDDGVNWEPRTSSNAGSGTTIAVLGRNGKVLLRGENSVYDGLMFISSGEYELYGNIMSLIYGESFVGKNTLTGNYTFRGLFSKSTKLKTAENLRLPATTLTISSYDRMFSGCTSLTTAPSVLPATTLAESCYDSMFEGCTSLTVAPELPATTLAVFSYGTMFRDCTSLTAAPKLSAETLADHCYYGMFFNCSSLTAAPELPARTLKLDCYRGMFRNCISLTNAPELPATTIEQGCYRDMFHGCTSLVDTPDLNASTLHFTCYEGMFSDCTSLKTAPKLRAFQMVSSCYEAMFSGCTSLENAPELPATTLDSDCYRNMFNGCTSLITAPVLPATNLKRDCYGGMFQDCTSLNYIKAMFTTTPSDTYTQDWVKGVPSGGTFIKNSRAVWDVTGDNGIPTGWAVQTA